MFGVGKSKTGIKIVILDISTWNQMPMSLLIALVAYFVLWFNSDGNKVKNKEKGNTIPFQEKKMFTKDCINMNFSLCLQKFSNTNHKALSTSHSALTMLFSNF